MNLEYLDDCIPKRWILLLYYWLPFFKPPSEFYFKCRDFINQLKHSGSKFFPLEKLPDLLFILERYTYISDEKKIAQKMISEIFTRKTKKIPLTLLTSIFEKFSPESKNIVIINEALRRIPLNQYKKYFVTLNDNNCSSLNLKWCAYLKDKFLLEDRLTLILSLPDNKLIANQSILSKLVIEECEEKLIKHKFDLTILNEETIKRLLNFIFKRKANTIFSNNFLQSFINQLLKARDTLLLSHILPLDVFPRYSFFKDFLAHKQNQENIEYFLGVCPTEQWPNLIDHVIVSIFNVSDVTVDNDSLIDNVNPNLLLLTQLQKESIRYPVNLFQLLAIQYLTKKTFNLEALKKVFIENQAALEYHKMFSPALQAAVAESNILAIKVFIKDHIMIHIAKENTRQNIHRMFYQFYNDDNYDTAQNIAELILKKLPQHLRTSCEENLSFLQQLLSHLYLIVKDPLIIKYKNEYLMESNKKQREYQEKIQACRELLLRIHDGRQSRVAYQRMEELFCDKAAIMQEKWKKNLGIHFFDANNKEEFELAEKEAAESRLFNSKYIDFYNLSTCLSTSPSLTGYLTY